MRRAYLLLASCIVVGALLGADPPVAAPLYKPARVAFATGEIRLKPGRLGRIEVTFTPAEGKLIRWINLADDLDLIPSESGKWAVVTSLTPRTYRVAAYSATADGQATEPSYCTIIVEGKKPDDDGGDDNKPANDPLLDVLLPIYGADQSPTKKDDVLKLAAVYDVASRTTVNDAALATRSQLVQNLVTAGRSMVPMPRLQAMRERIAGELDAKLGTDSASPLTTELRAKYAEQFARMAKLLKSLGGN